MRMPHQSRITGSPFMWKKEKQRSKFRFWPQRVSMRLSHNKKNSVLIESGRFGEKTKQSTSMWSRYALQIRKAPRLKSMYCDAAPLCNLCVARKRSQEGYGQVRCVAPKKRVCDAASFCAASFAGERDGSRRKRGSQAPPHVPACLRTFKSVASVILFLAKGWRDTCSTASSAGASFAVQLVPWKWNAILEPKAALLGLVSLFEITAQMW